MALRLYYNPSGLGTTIRGGVLGRYGAATGQRSPWATFFGAPAWNAQGQPNTQNTNPNPNIPPLATAPPGSPGYPGNTQTQPPGTRLPPLPLPPEPVASGAPQTLNERVELAGAVKTGIPNPSGDWYRLSDGRYALVGAQGRVVAVSDMPGAAGTPPADTTPAPAPGTQPPTGGTTAPPGGTTPPAAGAPPAGPGPTAPEAAPPGGEVVIGVDESGKYEIVRRDDGSTYVRPVAEAAMQAASIPSDVTPPPPPTGSAPTPPAAPGAEGAPPPEGGGPRPSNAAPMTGPPTDIAPPPLGLDRADTPAPPGPEPPPPPVPADPGIWNQVPAELQPILDYYIPPEYLQPAPQADLAPAPAAPDVMPPPSSASDAFLVP